ncbi:protein FAM149B1-like isoform X1 [Haliotis asinina]|uniref:protein FAM149B1-like isoform X1 n=1 Tax=Haliotis asinina TaxID=109174 RepID=UPI003531CEF7
MTLHITGVDPDTHTHLTYLLLKQLPHLSPSNLPLHTYTLAHTGRGKGYGPQLPPLIALGKGAPSSSSSSRVTSVSSSSGSFVRERLDEILVVRGRGFTRTPIDDRPPLDSVDEDPIMRQILQSIHEPVSSLNSTPASSGRSSPTIETHSTLSASHGGWTTGNTTERSSLGSSCTWDEFDRQAAKTVNQLFDEIERFLFEGSSENPSSIFKECKDWSTHFPHLRVLGTQKVEPQDEGFQEIPQDSPRLSSPGLLLDVTDNDISISADSQGLSVTGRQMKAMKAPVDAASIHTDRDYSNNEYAYLFEEILAQDGDYEEVIAIDYKDVHEDSEHKKQITPRRRRIGYPPITPNACVKDSVASSVFDCMWNEIISWMRPIIKEYSNLIESKQDLVPSSGFHVSPIGLHDPGRTTRDSSYMGLMQPRQFQALSLQRAHTHIGTTDPQKSIDGCLQISRVTLKNKNAPESTDSESVSPARPSSSMIGKRPTSVKMLPYPSRRKALAPLPDRSKTPSVEEEMPNSICIKRITPAPLQKNTALPPLGYDLQQEKGKRKMSSLRVSSAIENKDVRTLHFSREKSNPSIDPRPSTTHAMRSDTPFQMGTSGRRSSTPLGYSRGMLHGSKSLGITGSSLQHSSDLGPPPNIMENEGMEESPLHNQWPPNASRRRTVRT